MHKNSVKAIIKRLYEAVEESKVTSHKWHDFGWEGIDTGVAVVQRALKEIGEEYDNEFFYEVDSVAGYSADNHTKTWVMQIVDSMDKRICGGQIRAYAAGTVEDPWKSYDFTITFWVD